MQTANLKMMIVTGLCAFSVFNVARAQQVDHYTPDSLLSEAKPLKVHVGPIASGNRVMQDHEVFDRLSEAVRKVLGVEMEAAALFAVAQVRGLPLATAFVISDSLADLVWSPRFHDPGVQAGLVRLFQAAVAALLKGAE